MNTLEKIELFKHRTKNLALMAIRLFQSLPRKDEAMIFEKQLFRPYTSVAANYRVACRARSDAEFYCKISIVVDEADETLFWLELLNDSGILSNNEIQNLLNEYLEVVKIANAIRHNNKK